ncbi:MAG: putative membrane-bound dehydrogenase-like protein, partial [Pseudoalteromonas tetraodonis]
MRSFLFLLLTCLALQAFPFCPHGLGAEKITIAPHTFTIPDGYVLKRVAAPPLVQRPIHMCFDDEGVLYVTDSSGNTDNAPAQLKDPQHRVLRLVDHDGDGVFDESTVFAEHLPFPEGILVHEGAVYVGAPPHIWKLRDTDGDHVADERTSWFDGGSIEGCGNDLHGPYIGTDGFFYWCKGAFAPQSHVLGNGEMFKSNAAHIYRARPDGSELEVVITGGMNNPVGLTFSETGERFLSGTFFDLSGPGKRDGILHAIYGGMYGKKNDRVLAPHPTTGGLLPILTQMGPAAPSGIVMPKNDAHGLRGDLFCSDFNLRRISRHQLSRDGSTYSATTSSFIESDQSDFHPTDVIEDADGSLLVADTGSWYMICCPTSKVAKPHILGAIYRIQKEDSPVSKDPRGLDLDWNQPEISWLSDRRPAVVTRAIEAVAKESNLEELRSAKARVPALWALHRIPGDASRTTVREFLDDESAEVRAAAIHSVGLWRDPDALEALIKLLAGNDDKQSRLAAMALGRIGDRRASKPLLEAASKGVDAFLRHAIIYALYEIGDTDNLPEDHPLGKQVSLMHEVNQRNATPHAMPEIRLADAVDADPAKLVRQTTRLQELTALLPKGDPARGEKLFHNATKSLCITCHVMGDQGVKFGPDLTGIGSIRSEQDLLEAIVYPSSSIARYYELVTMQTKNGETGGLILRDNVDQMVLAPAPGVELPIPIKEIKAAKYSNLSLMPEVFDSLLKPGEIADLVAYLKSTKLPGATTAATDKPSEQQEIPDHLPVNLPGLHAYAQKSIAAGEEIEFRVSSRVPYDLNVVQLGADPENRDQDPVLETFKVEKPQSQPIHPGSYVHVSNGLPDERRLSQLTLEGWIRPFNLAGWQGLITQHDYPNRCGIGLFLNDDRIVFMTGTGGTHDPASLHQTEPGLIKAQRWHHIAASWDGKSKRIYIDGKLAAEFPFAGVVRPGRTAIRIGAYASDGVAASFYNGDIAMCAMHGRALDREQVQNRFADRGLTAPQGNSVLGCWPFDEERGTKVADAGSDGRDG